jgi:DNA invertase Pin-like site-specific DNA recombinase
MRLIEMTAEDVRLGHLRVLGKLGSARTTKRAAAERATEEVRQAVLAALRDGSVSEHEAARVTGVDRMTIRAWLGKR